MRAPSRPVCGFNKISSLGPGNGACGNRTIFKVNGVKRRIITTGDGSKTIQIEEWNEQYHSLHGAVQEAYHVFIDHGLRHLPQNQLDILEIGFGTGLNALITFSEAQKEHKKIRYCGVEKYPFSIGEIKQLNYCEALGFKKLQEIFAKMHICDWQKEVAIHENFLLIKRQQDFLEIDDQNAFDLVYFDAFGARVQPELWTVEVFEKMFKALRSKGVLVTYAAKGSVRRAMQSVGFSVERLPGPPGKREMLRATKP